MPRGYRCIVIAAVGWLALCGAQPPAKQDDSNKGAQKAAPTAQATAPPAPATPASPPGKFAAYPDYNAEACYKADDKDAADLCAQWRAAIAAEKAAHQAWRANLFAIIAATLSLATVVGLIVTIWQTSGALSEARRGNRINLIFERRARREARKSDAAQARALEIAEENAAAAHKGANNAARSARTAAEANALARESMRRQMRPYVYLKSHSIAYDHMAMVDYIGDKAEVVLLIRNFGQSPAKELHLRARAFIGGVWNAPFEQGLEDVRAISLADLPPGFERDVDGYTVVGIRDAHQFISEGTQSVFIEGQITYRDGFGERYHTNFRLASTDRDYPKGDFATCPDWNSAS